ncbi:hypothetical protein [Luteimonas salinilitoris]|uniref:Uncharacterized protein n=1 Tax=Luteimonas salinilitoris TaxID=3237697 RepID=A0ABV4HQS9_9GAMM
MGAEVAIDALLHQRRVPGVIATEPAGAALLLGRLYMLSRSFK